MLLKLHKYLDWADKKLHSVFFIENKDQINEDLLLDFAEGNVTQKKGIIDKQGKPVKPKANTPAGIRGGAKPQLASHHEFLYGNMRGGEDVVNVESEKDFPSLGAPPKQTAGDNTWGKKNMFDE